MSTLRSATLALKVLFRAIESGKTLVRGLPDGLAVVRVEVLVDRINKFKFFEVLQVQESVKDDSHVFFHCL